jgi:histidine ammonia-lyase
MTVRVSSPAELDAAAVLRVAGGEDLVLDDALLTALDAARSDMLAALEGSGPVYGVSTGMGLLSHLAVDSEEQQGYQDDLMLARAVGAEPWLDPRTTRAVVAVRLRTLLDPEVGASADLARALAALLDRDDVHVPSRGNGAAGEIIPLAHLGLALRSSYSFGPKEGVAFLQGVPVATARAVLLSADARLLARQSLVATAGSVALARAPRDPYDAALTRGDALLGEVHATLRALAGDEGAPRMLQAPVSFRVAGPATAALLRAADALDAAVQRALDGVTTSPALVEGRFLGTAGFDGFDLASALDGVRIAALHAAEVGTARLHRLLDPRVTALPPQLSAEPGRQAGMVTVHKRAVGLVHEARVSAVPASIGTMETSAGQEDVQSFGLHAAHELDRTLAVLRDVTACELLALHQARLLDASPPRGSEQLQMVLHKASEPVSRDANDRAFGADVSTIANVLRVGWAHDVVLHPPDAASHL